MKILPRKKDLDKAKADERKRQIDEGMSLATKVDKLRKTVVEEEAQLHAWRTNTIKNIQGEIDDYIVVRENLRVQTEAAEVYRKELIRPLDEEWKVLNTAKLEVQKEKESIYLSRESLKKDKQDIEEERKKVTQIVSRISKKERETDKAKEEILSLRDLAQKEYEIAHEERITKAQNYDKKIISVDQLHREYEVGIETNKIVEKQLQEKESELITRENDLTRRTKNLQRVEGIKDAAKNI